MAIVFPASPSNNDTFTVGSITYTYDGSKWIGLGVTPTDRLIEGNNNLQINASNNLVWTGNQVHLVDTAETTASLFVGSTKKSSWQAQDNFGTILYSYDDEPLIFSVASGGSFSRKLTIDSLGSAQFTGTNSPAGRDTRISQYGSLLVATTDEIITSARCSIDAGNGNIATEGALTTGGQVTAGTTFSIANVSGSISGSGGGEDYIGLRHGSTFGLMLKTFGTNVGNVGIGETSPADRLVVQKTNASGDVGVRIKNDTLTDGDSTNPTTASLYLNTSTTDFNTFYIQTRRNDGSTHFGRSDPREANHTPHLVITSNGLVGIGTDDPTRQLSVYNASNSGVEIRSNTDGQSSVFFTDTADTNIGMIGYMHNDDSMFFRVNDETRVTIDSGGDVGVNTITPSDRFHVTGAILQQGVGSGVRSIVITATFGSGTTHNIFTCTATGPDNVAVATMEYVALYSYSGSNHCAGIKLASTRRSGTNTVWTNVPNVNAAGPSGSDTSISPNLFFENGVLMVTVGTSVQITATVRITVRGFTLTRNYNAG